MSNNIKSTLLSIALSITDGKFDEAATRAIIRRKLEDVPAIIRKATMVKVEDILPTINPSKHTAIKLTMYVPKVELE